MPLDRGAVRALGRRLERSRAPNDTDLDELAALQASYLPALEVVSGQLRLLLGTPPTFEGIELASTSRVKTVATVVEKLRKHETSLERMRDVVGVRVVGDLSRIEQDRLVEAIARTLSVSESAIIDRRALPRHGYRAVHVIPEIEGYPVEIQVRTKLQHLWANGMERMGDVFGRQIRYGGPPEAASPEQLARRQLLIDEYKQQAEALADYEAAYAQHIRVSEAIQDALDSIEVGGPRWDGRETEGLKDQLLVARRALAEATSALTAQMARVAELLESP